MVALLTHQDVCNTLPACAPANMDWGWCALRTVDPHGLYELKYRFSYIRSCSYSAPCANGEGDCDNDSDCQCVVHIPIQDIPSKIVFKVRLLRLQCWLELWSDHQLRACCFKTRRMVGDRILKYQDVCGTTAAITFFLFFNMHSLYDRIDAPYSWVYC